MAQLLSQSQIQTEISGLTDWIVSEDGLSIGKTFRFKDFSEAFGWMARVALAAERLDHHPDWCNTYAKVQVKLSTHDSGGVTQKDVDLARFMERFA